MLSLFLTTKGAKMKIMINVLALMLIVGALIISGCQTTQSAALATSAPASSSVEETQVTTAISEVDELTQTSAEIDQSVDFTELDDVSLE